MKRFKHPALAVALISLLLWELSVKSLNMPLWLLPAPSDIFRALWDTKELIWAHSQTTILETTLGFALAVIFGLLVGALMDLIPALKRAFYPFLVISQTIPLIAIAPLLTLWLGYGILPKIVIVVLVCFFPIAISLIEGLEATDKDLLNLLRSMGASRWQVFFHARWPNAMPSLFAGLKIAATYSVTAAIIGEWLGASSGLGVYLTRASHSFLTDRVFASIVVISVLSLAYFALVSFLGKLMAPWIQYNQAENYKK